MIRVEDVSRSFGSIQAVRKLSFDVPRGEVIGFIGPNGAGKTTTIRLLGAILRPNEGRLSVNGFDPVTDGDRVRASIGVLTEGAGLYPNMTALDNLRFFAELYGVDDPGRPAALIESMGLAAHATRRVGGYSTGMKKRLGLAKALIHRPPVLLLDEPTSGLDPEGITMVLEEVHRLARTEGVTVVLCSHILHQLEMVCDRYVIINAGHTLAQGTLEELVEEHSSQRTVELETDLGDDEARQIASELGVSVSQVSSGRVRFEVPDVGAIPRVIAAAAGRARVFSAARIGEDLQSVYFRVMEANNHE